MSLSLSSEAGGDLLVFTMNIEAASERDAEAILQLQRLAYQSEAELYEEWNIPPLTESLQQLRADFREQSFLKACCAQPPFLVGAVRALFRDDTCSIGRLIVHPERQGQGIAGALLRQVERSYPQARRFELFTGHRSLRNLSIYQHLGYVPFREQRISDQVTLVFLQKTAHPTLDFASLRH